MPPACFSACRAVPQYLLTSVYVLYHVHVFHMWMQPDWKFVHILFMAISISMTYLQPWVLQRVQSFLLQCANETFSHHKTVKASYYERNKWYHTFWWRPLSLFEPRGSVSPQVWIITLCSCSRFPAPFTAVAENPADHTPFPHVALFWNVGLGSVVVESIIMLFHTVRKLELSWILASSPS